MSLDAMDWVWTNSQSKGVARLVMLAIADKAKERTCKAFASMTFLQERANAGRSTVVGAVRDLTDSGELEIVADETGPFGASVYRLPKALGHVRGDIYASRGSVQKPNRSAARDDEENGADPVPNQESTDIEIGAGSEPIDGCHAAQIGAETEPVAPEPTGGIGAESAPNGQQLQNGIGADSGRQSVQILDGIGADSAPPIHHTPKEHQKTNTPPADAVEEKPKRGQRMKPGEVAPRFAEFYAAYPKRKAPADAEKAWTKAIKNGFDPQVIIDAASSYAAQRKNENPKYTPLPATWLNGKRWLDEDDEPYQPTHPFEQLPFQPPEDTSGYYGAI